ncbi:MAG: hypothetical protein RIS47_1257, partial [Bacteroidota bacterium]
MSANIENLLLQAQELEATNDYKKLTEVYRSIATCYHRIKDKQKEVEYLKKSKDAATQLDSGGVREQAQIKFASIMDLPDGHEKEDLLLKFHKDNPLVLSAAFELGNFYERQANYPSAILYYESVLFLVENQTPPLTKDQEENKAQLYLGLIGCYKKG